MKAKPPILAIASYPAVVGAVLARMRKSENMAQSDIASAIGATVSTWSRIESGESALTIEQLAAAAQKLDVKPSEILKTADDKVSELQDRGIQIWSDRGAFLEAAAKLGAVPLLGASLLAVLAGPTGAAAALAARAVAAMRGHKEKK